MTERFINHITLDTGHSRRSPRSEVSDEALRAVQTMLEQALAGGTPEVLQGCTLRAAAEGSCLSASVWKQPGESAPSVPLVTIGVALRSRSGAQLWRMMHETAVRAVDNPLATSPDRVPSEPWCAVRLEPGIVSFPQATEWLGDFERCLAWAWLERRTPN